MQLPVFENAYLLVSIGWAIVNSLWQTGILWLLYICIAKIEKRLPALIKHHLGVILLSTSFLWFIVTIVQNYRLLSGPSSFGEIITTGIRVAGSPYLSGILPIFSIFYLLSLLFFTIQFGRNLFANHSLQTGELIKAPIDFRLFASQAALQLGIKKKIRVWITRNVDVPSVTGFMKPVILLPAAIINHLSIQQTEAILLHELAHIRRNDYLVNLFQSVVEMVLFFNPFVHLLIKELKKERENCCDDWVMTFQYDRHQYSNALLILEEQRQHLSLQFALAATNNKKNLLHRVKRLFTTSPKTSFNSIQKFKLAGLCCLLLPVMFTLHPFLKHKSVIDLAADYPLNNKKEKLKLVTFDKFPKENYSKINFTNSPSPVKTGNKKIPLSTSTSKNKKKRPLRVQEIDYLNAYINEELLNPTITGEPVITRVSEKESNHSKYFIKIEEQQSGIKQINTFYFELNTQEEKEPIKPLIMLNRIIAPDKKSIPENNPDSLDTSKRPLIKKRITT